MKKTLRILLACPVSGNPYISELVKNLNAQELVVCRQSHTEFLDSDMLDYDVVHFQWPEAIFGWNSRITEKEVEYLNDRLAYCRKKGIKIVITVHNEAPHTIRGNSDGLLYELIYRNADAFIHLGRTSLQLTLQLGRSTPSAQHFVIPHGNYDFFKQVADAFETSTKRNRFRVLCFGAVRKPSEVKIICEVSDLISSFGGELILAGRINSGSRKRLQYYQMRLPLYFRQNIKQLEGKVPDGEVASLVSSCDSLLIPRVDTLNSGNVALGLTFGKVILGPSIGNIGEELIKLGNPTFDPLNPSSIRSAVTEMRDKVGSDLGKRNRIYAETKLAWSYVAELHEKAYRCLQDIW